MIYKTICVFVLLFALQGNVFCSSPRFRDEFFIENRTRERIVVVVEGNRYAQYFRYDCDDERYVLLNFIGWTNYSDSSSIPFRTVRPKTLFHNGLYDIGVSQYNYEDFNNKTPEAKFSAFFSFILIYNDRGDLLHRIDDFSQFRIEDRSGSRGIYVLIIE